MTYNLKLIRRRRIRLWRIAYGLLVFFLLSNISFAQPITSNILIEQAKELNGQEVEFEGEVVSDIMKRSTHCWINVHDGFNAIGIWAHAQQASIINFSGNYHNTGDTVLVRGIFYRACPEHGGDLDIHAITIDKIKNGEETPHSLTKTKIDTVLALLLLLLLIAFLTRTKQKERRPYASHNF